MSVPVSRIRLASESVAVLGGTAANGLAAYAYIAVGTRTYGDAAMAPVAVLWTFWAVSVALFSFPIQHWAIRRIAIDGDTAGVAAEVPRLAAVVATIAVLVGLPAVVWSEALFDDRSAIWGVLVVALMMGSAFTGLQRGVLSGRGRYYATAANIAAENVLRLGAAIVAAVAGATVLGFAAALLAGPFAALFWPEAVRLRGGGVGRRSSLRFLGGLAGGVLIAQIVLNAGPVVLRTIGGSPSEVTALFLVLALFRAPYLLALGVATRVTEPLTRVATSASADRLRLIVARMVVSTVALAVVGGVSARFVGPWIIELIFAPDRPASAAIVAAMAVGTAFALGGLALVLLLTAMGRSAPIQTAWGGALAAGWIVVAAWPGERLVRVVAAFLIAEVTAVALLAWFAVRVGRQFQTEMSMPTVSSSDLFESE